MAGITTYLSVLTLNVDGLNTPIKRYRLINWIKKTQFSLFWEKQETHLMDRKKHWPRVKTWKRIYQANESPKQEGTFSR
jgi:hypothetical protein